jgi:hypothetical protein
VNALMGTRFAVAISTFRVNIGSSCVRIDTQSGGRTAPVTLWNFAGPSKASRGRARDRQPQPIKNKVDRLDTVDGSLRRLTHTVL